MSLFVTLGLVGSQTELAELPGWARRAEVQLEARLSEDDRRKLARAEGAKAAA